MSSLVGRKPVLPPGDGIPSCAHSHREPHDLPNVATPARSTSSTTPSCSRRSTASCSGCSSASLKRDEGGDILVSSRLDRSHVQSPGAGNNPGASQPRIFRDLQVGNLSLESTASSSSGSGSRIGDATLAQVPSADDLQGEEKTLRRRLERTREANGVKSWRSWSSRTRTWLPKLLPPLRAPTLLKGRPFWLK